MPDKEDLFKNMKFLQNPLTTEEGFINESCLKELESVLKNFPKTYEREDLKKEEEWATKRIVLRGDIVGSFAKWSCRLHQNNCPNNLEKVCKYFNECLKRDIKWKIITDDCGDFEYTELSLLDINRLCHNILGDFNFVLEWNQEEGDFIDLDALFHNVCLDIREERRASDQFDKEFDAKWNNENS